MGLSGFGNCPANMRLPSGRLLCRVLAWARAEQWPTPDWLCVSPLVPVGMGEFVDEVTYPE